MNDKPIMEAQEEKVSHCPSCNKEYKGEEIPSDNQCPECPGEELVKGSALVEEDDDLDDEELEDEDLDGLDDTD